MSFFRSLLRTKKQPPVPHRVMVISVPKSGTYLVGKLLANLGLAPTSMHFSDDGASYTNYGSASGEDESLAGYTKLEVYRPFSETIWLIHPGQFAVGHLACTAGVAGTLAQANYKMILTVRDLRAAVVSLMRFQVQAHRTTPDDQIWLALDDGPGRTLGFLDSSTSAWFFQIVRRMIPWLNTPGQLLVSFEALYGDYGGEAQLAEVKRLHQYLEIECRDQACQTVLRRTIGAKTLTYSGERTKTGKYWDERVEERFIQLGGAALQKEYGYSPIWDRNLRDSGRAA